MKKMKTQMRKLLSGLGLLIATRMAVQAQYIYTTLDFPSTNGGSANGCYAAAIDGTNIVGGYTDASGQGHGFLYNGSTWTTLDDPVAAGYTVACGVSGTNIVGYYSDSNHSTHGFLYNGSTWTTLEDPDGSDTQPSSIRGGNVVGLYRGQDHIVHGFLATPQPQLSFSASGHNAVLSWPVNLTSFTLQSTTDLSASSNWSNVSITPVVIQGLNTVTNPMSGTHQFYRLSH